MKWLPLPSVPSCSRQSPTYDAGSKPALLGHGLELRDPRRGGRDDLVVLRARRQRDGTLDLLTQFTQRAGCGIQIGARELRTHGDHAAADVDADGCGHDGTQRRDDRPDGRAETQVGIGHERQVRVDERHRRGRARLRFGVVLEDAGPAEQPGGDLLHGPFDSSGGDGCAQEVERDPQPRMRFPDTRRTAPSASGTGRRVLSNRRRVPTRTSGGCADRAGAHNS